VCFILTEVNFKAVQFDAIVTSSTDYEH